MLSISSWQFAKQQQRQQPTNRTDGYHRVNSNGLRECADVDGNCFSHSTAKVGTHNACSMTVADKTAKRCSQQRNAAVSPSHTGYDKMHTLQCIRYDKVRQDTGYDKLLCDTTTQTRRRLSAALTFGRRQFLHDLWGTGRSDITKMMTPAGNRRNNSG